MRPFPLWSKVSLRLLRRISQQGFDLAVREMPGRGAEHFLEVLDSVRLAGIADVPLGGVARVKRTVRGREAGFPSERYGCVVWDMLGAACEKP